MEMDNGFKFEEIFFDCYEPIKSIPYRVLDNDALVKLRMSLDSDEKRSVFRATQYDHYVKDGYYPMFGRGSGGIGTFVDIDVHQCAQILCFFDQKIDFKKIEEKQGNVVEKLSVNEIVYETVTDEEFNRLYYEAKTVLSGILDKEYQVAIPYAGCGASIKAARDLGFYVWYYESRVFKYDFGEPISVMDDGVGANIIRCLSVDDMHEIDFNKVVFFLHHCIDRDETLVDEAIYHLSDVIVCDTRQIYPGYVHLKPTGHSINYQVATSLKDYLACGVLSFVDEVKYEQLNPHIISRFKQYIFNGVESIAIIKFLLMLDPKKTLKYYAVGEMSDNINKYFKFQKFVIDGPVLYIVADASCIVEGFKSGDSVYNVLLKHEMGITYLNNLLPFMGLISQVMLLRLGFMSSKEKIANATVYGGMINSTLDIRELQVNRPYIMCEPSVAQFWYDSGQVGNDSIVSINKLFGDYSIVIFKEIGFVKMKLSCPHPGMGIDDKSHFHAYRVLKKSNVNSQNMLVSPRRNQIQKLPRIFSIDSVKSDLIDELRFNYYGADIFLRDLSHDFRVKHTGDGVWFLNPMGTPFLHNDDRKKLCESYGLRDIDITNGVNAMFSFYRVKSVIDTIEFDVDGDFMYDTPELQVVDVESFRSLINFVEFEQCVGQFTQFADKMNNSYDVPLRDKKKKKYFYPVLYV